MMPDIKTSIRTLMLRCVTSFNPSADFRFANHASPRSAAREQMLAAYLTSCVPLDAIDLEVIRIHGVDELNSQREPLVE